MVKSANFYSASSTEIAFELWKKVSTACSSAGHRIDRKEVGYSLQGTTATKIFRGFNALGTIAFSFGDAMLPEIQVPITHSVHIDLLVHQQFIYITG
jgi:hypothetical protein